ncbi:MAG: TetR/AcrR family transcriptional regulator [Acidobacteriaceae bacterium]|nr:TetR/AcrR family transcriptional regulator [Acidobacteriaceae bacterium]
MRELARPNKHQQRTEETRRRLLKAALQVFARDGFEAARIEDISTAAGHTRGAFYANFESKEDVFFALLEQQIGKHLTKLQRLFECCPTAEGRLVALREYYVERITDRPWVLLILEFKLFALRHRRLRAHLARRHRRVRFSTKREIMTRLFPARVQLNCDSDEVRRAALEAALNGLVLEHAYDPKRISEEQAVSVLRRVFDLLMQPE